MLCPKCNTNNPYGSTFCAGCGAALIDSEKAQLSIADSSNNYGKTTVNANNNYYENSPYNTQPQAPAYSGQTNQVQNQQPYQQNMINYGSYTNPEEGHVSTLAWIGIFCIPLIPVVGWLVQLILMFVWAFGGTNKISLRNYARAALIVAAVAILLMILIFAVAGVSFSEIIDQLD